MDVYKPAFIPSFVHCRYVMIRVILCAITAAGISLYISCSGIAWLGEFHEFIGCFATSVVMLGWKKINYYYETDELPQPKANPTREKTV